jgi:hypothetical protein
MHNKPADECEGTYTQHQHPADPIHAENPAFDLLSSMLTGESVV